MYDLLCECFGLSSILYIIFQFTMALITPNKWHPYNPIKGLYTFIKTFSIASNEINKYRMQEQNLEFPYEHWFSQKIQYLLP